MKTLKELAKFHNTDKCDIYHTYLGKTYIDLYDSFFSSIRLEKLKILELGVLNGSSVNMWSEYFENSVIYGLDKIIPNNNFSDRIKLFEGGQDDRVVLQKIIEDANGSIDIVIDDASHINDLTIESYIFLFKFTNIFYIIEDLANSYKDIRTEIKKWPNMEYVQNSNINANNSQTRKKIDDIILDIIHKIDLRQENISNISIYNQILFITKG